jgi:hypothetical protein
MAHIIMRKVSKWLRLPAAIAIAVIFLWGTAQAQTGPEGRPTPPFALTGTGWQPAQPAPGGVSAQALTPVNCLTMPSPVLGFDISKGQDSNDLADLTGSLAGSGFSAGTVNLGAGAIPACVDVLIVHGLAQNRALLAVYNAAEGQTLRDWVIAGHGLLLNGDWGSFKTGTAALFTAFGYTPQGQNPVTDPTDFDSPAPPPANAWVLYQADNFAGHPVLANVTALELLASSWLTPTTGAIVTTDADATPANAAVMAAQEVGTGCVVLVTDSNWYATEGYAKANNGLVARQMVNWLRGCASPAAVNHTVYLPLIINIPPTFPIFIGDEIPSRPAPYKGIVFYSTTIQIPAALPEGGRFYLSSRPYQVSPVVVDDDIVLRIGNTIYFVHHFSPGGRPPGQAILEIPRTTMAQLAGQTVTVEYRDVYAALIAASEMWLVWTP